MCHDQRHTSTQKDTQEPSTFLNALKKQVSSSCPGVLPECFLVTIPESCLEKTCLIEFRVHMLKKNTKIIDFQACHHCANTDLPYVLYFHVCFAHKKQLFPTLLWNGT